MSLLLADDLNIERPVPYILDQLCLVDLLVGLGPADVQVFRKALKPIPASIQLQALIDTGADSTCLDPKIVQTLGLPLASVTLANMPAVFGLGESGQYRAAVAVMHPSGDPRDSFAVAEMLICELPLQSLGLSAVIGRDMLDQMRFIYDGPGRAFSLDWV